MKDTPRRTWPDLADWTDWKLSPGGAEVALNWSLLVGAIHGQILPRVLFSPPGSPIVTPPGLAARLAGTLINGIAPKPPGR